MVLDAWQGERVYALAEMIWVTKDLVSGRSVRVSYRNYARCEA